MGTDFRAEIQANFQPENPHDKRCKEFIEKYLLTGEHLNVSLSLERTVIKLASSAISIPRFKLACTIEGLNKAFIPRSTLYISICRAVVMREIDLTFDFGTFSCSFFE